MIQVPLPLDSKSDDSYDPSALPANFVPNPDSVDDNLVRAGIDPTIDISLYDIDPNESYSLRFCVF